MIKYELALFDVDGTLLNTTEGVLASIIYTINELGLPLPEYDTLLSFIGPPIQSTFASYFGLKDGELKKSVTLFRNRYKDFELLKAVPYDGIYQTLDKLAENKVKIGIATYKREDYALRLLKHFEFDRYTSIIHGADANNVLKKKAI